MVVLKTAMQNNGETVYFDQPLPKVHFMKLLSCSLYNSWDTLNNEGSVGLIAKKIVLLDLFPNWPLVIMILIVWPKKISYLFSEYNNRGLKAETNTPIGQLVINNFGEKQINLDHDLAKLFGIGQNLPLKTIIKRITSPTAYFIHCDLIDRNNNLFNGKRSNLLAKFDVKGKPYEKVRYDASLQQTFRDCWTDS